jgi:hypothetical protein
MKTKPATDSEIAFLKAFCLDSSNGLSEHIRSNFLALIARIEKQRATTLEACIYLAAEAEKDWLAARDNAPDTSLLKGINTARAHACAELRQSFSLLLDDEAQP